jgi:hypothetical protein
MSIKIFSQFWSADWHLSLLLGLLLLIIFVLYPMGDHGPVVSILTQSVFSLILIAGVTAVATSRTALVVATLLAVGTGITGWIKLYSPSSMLTLLSVSMWILFLIMLVWVTLTRVFREGRINSHRIQGAIAVYLLVGMIWCGCYRLTFQLDMGAFNIPAATDDPTLMSKLLYFSFVTLTTVGYGDIAAVHPVARSLAMLEALIGQLFPAILIARLVSMEVSHRL